MGCVGIAGDLGNDPIAAERGKPQRRIQCGIAQPGDAVSGLAIILDDNNVLPKWLGYYTVWQYVTELMAAPVWISKSGPFAWNGLMTFWFAMILYVSWQMIVYVCIFRSIRKQPEAELENVWLTDESASRDTLPKAAE